MRSEFFRRPRRSKVDAIVSAMREVPGVYLLDRESDADHNRSVITLAGEPEAVAEAALRGVGKAAELIDLTTIPARIRAWARPTWCRLFQSKA